MSTAQEFLDQAQRAAGLPYFWGGKHSGPGLPARGFDCSGLVTWACEQVGITAPHGDMNQRPWSIPVTVSRAIETPGALLFFEGHVAISRGDNTTIEARGASWGVGNFSALGRGWKWGGLIPGLTYGPVHVPPGIIIGNAAPHEEEVMKPILLIRSPHGEAIFARFSTGEVRHLGGDETGYWISQGVPVIEERDAQGYLRIVEESGTSWRP